MTKIAYRYWDKQCHTLYVAQVQGEGGVDWGYTLDYKKAKPLNKYWRRRFAADMRRMNVEARFI